MKSILAAFGAIVVLAFSSPVFAASVEIKVPHGDAHSDLCFNVRGASLAQGAAIIQWPCSANAPNEVFELVKKSNGYYNIQEVGTNNCIRPTGGGTAQNTLLDMEACDPSHTSQEYTVKTSSLGAVSFVNHKSGRCIDVPGNAETSDLQLQIYDCNGTAAQSFLVDALSSPVPAPSSTPSPSPSPIASASPSPTPTKASWPIVYNPSLLSEHFPSSPFFQPLNPVPNANSASWLAQLGDINLNHFQFAANSQGASQDYTFPIYVEPTSLSEASTIEEVTLHCTNLWAPKAPHTCNVEGQKVLIDTRWRPEDFGTAGDSHITIIDIAGGREIDMWGTQWPPAHISEYAGPTLTAAFGGACTLSGNGFTNTADPGNGACGATATSNPLTVGDVRVADLLAAAKTENGVLPYALSLSTKCSANYAVAPFLGSDGHNNNCAPEGTRVYIAMHDSQVNALGLPPIMAALVRTLDEDHRGGYVTDTNGGQDGFSIQAESDLNYTVYGLPGPWVTQFLPEALKEKLPGATSPYNNVYQIGLPIPAAVQSAFRMQ